MTGKTESRECRCFYAIHGRGFRPMHERGEPQHTGRVPHRVGRAAGVVFRIRRAQAGNPAP